MRGSAGRAECMVGRQTACCNTFNEAVHVSFGMDSKTRFVGFFVPPAVLVVWLGVAAVTHAAVALGQMHNSWSSSTQDSCPA